jgi:hypothetical protein
MAAIQPCHYSQSIVRLCIRYQLDNYFMAYKRPPPPVLRNTTKHFVFNLIPLAGPGRKMAHLYYQSCLVSQLL